MLATSLLLARFFFRRRFTSKSGEEEGLFFLCVCVYRRVRRGGDHVRVVAYRRTRRLTVACATVTRDRFPSESDEQPAFSNLALVPPVARRVQVSAVAPQSI